MGTIARARYKGGVAVQLAGPVQTKVTLGKTGDRYEQEADAVSDRVTAGQTVPEISRIPPGGLRAQRQTDETDTESEENSQSRDESKEPLQEQAENRSTTETVKQQSRENVDENAQSAIQMKTDDENTVQSSYAPYYEKDAVQTRDDEEESASDFASIQSKQEIQDDTSDADTQEKGWVQTQPNPTEEASSEQRDGQTRAAEDEATTSSQEVQAQEEEGESADTEETASEEGNEEQAADADDSASEERVQEDNEETGDADEAATASEEDVDEQKNENPEENGDQSAEEIGCGGESEGGAEESEAGGESEGGCGGSPQGAAEEPASGAEGAEVAEESDVESAGEEAAGETQEEGSGDSECDTDAQERPLQLQEQEQAPEQVEQTPSEDDDQEPSIGQTKSSRGQGNRSGGQREAIAGRTIKNSRPGEPLSPRVQLRLENALGFDLSHVRLHTSARARDTNKELKSKAFTHKNHIWLGPGQSPFDMKLLAHEMTHVIQQGGVQRRKGAQPATSNNRAERDGIVDRSAEGARSSEQLLNQYQSTVQNLQSKTDGLDDRREDESIQQQNDTKAGSTKLATKSIPMPTSRLNKFAWKPGDLEIANSAVKLYVNDIELSERKKVNYIICLSERKKKEILELIEAGVNVMWRSFKAYVDDSGGLNALSQGERDYIEAEKGNVKAAESGLTPDAKIPKKDQKSHALRRSALKAMGHLLKDPYFIYWMFNTGTIVLWKEVSDKNVAIDIKGLTKSVKDASSGPSFIRSVIRTNIYSKMAARVNLEVEVEDVWLMLQPEETTAGDKETAGGEGEAAEKDEPLGGEFTKKRERSLTRQQKKLLKRLPKNIRKSKDRDGRVNLLDRLLAMSKEERDAFIKHLHQKEVDQKGEKKRFPKKEAPKKDDRIEPEKIADEIKAAKIVTESTRDQEGKSDLERQKQVIELLSKVTDEERRAFLTFLEENKGKTQDGKPLDIKTLYDRYKELSEADKEALRLKRMLGEKQADPSQQLTRDDRKNVQILVNKAKADAKRYKIDAKSINKSIKALLSELDDGKAKRELKPLDPEDFEVIPEMIMLEGMMAGAGHMSPEIRGVADELKEQIGQIKGKIIEEIGSIAAELALHVVLSAIPFVGWLKAAATIGRLVQLGRKLNKLRKKLRALKKGYDVYQRVRAAVETARSVIVHARGFVEKFEAARRNWEFLPSQLERLDSPDELDERIEAVYDQLMEQLHDKLNLIEPLMDKMYLPLDVREDPEKLLQILFNLPLGVKAFSSMVDSYRELGAKADADQLRLLYYKGMEAGILLYPLVGFVIGALSEALESWLQKSKNIESFIKRQASWSKRGKRGSKTGGKLRSLWPRRMEYEGHIKKYKPQFEKHLDYAMGELQKEIPTPAPWKFRLRTYLRFWLRGFVKRMNRKGFKARGRRKGSKESYHPVPVPKFKYKLRTQKGVHTITLRINPPRKRTIKQFDLSAFDGDGVPRPDRRTKEGKVLERWLDKNDYDIHKLPSIGWHIRRKGARPATKKRPYLRFTGNLIKKGLESKEGAVLDRFVAAGRKIFGSEQLPEGFHLRTDRLPSRRPGSRAKEKYTVSLKNYAKSLVADKLHLDKDGKLKRGPSPTSKGPEIKLADPPGAIKKPTEFDTKKRPKKAEGKVGYTVNKDRGAMDKISDMRKNDDRGHVIAARFNGVGSKENLVPMNKDLNRKKAWWKEETSLANSYIKALKNAALVDKTAVAQIWIYLDYASSNPRRRPNSFDFRWDVKEEGKTVDSGKMPTTSNP